MNCRLMIEKANPPKTIQYLTVLQGADANGSAASAVAVASTSGNANEGVIVNGMMVMFKVNMLSDFTGVTFDVPGGVAAVYITGL
ncbi:hypothetical protein BH11ARM2_BH11ARM2_11140 [soil metagenome]